MCPARQRREGGLLSRRHQGASAAATRRRASQSPAPIEWHAGRRPSGRTSLATRWIDAGTICAPAPSAPGHALSAPAVGSCLFARARLSPAFARPRAHGNGTGRDNGRRASRDARPGRRRARLTRNASSRTRTFYFANITSQGSDETRKPRDEDRRKGARDGGRDGTPRDARREEECTNRTEARAVARGLLADATRSERAKGRSVSSFTQSSGRRWLR